MSVRIKELAAQITWFQRQMFGRRSEKHLALDNIPSLFDNIEISAPVNEEPQEDTPVEKSVFTRKNQSPVITGRIFQSLKL